MKIICTQENLKSGLLTVSKIISASNTLPVLNTVLLETSNGLLTLSSTNLEISIVTQIRGMVEEEGGVCIPAKQFTELISSFPSSNIKLSLNNNTLLIETEKHKANIKTISKEDFPLIPKIEDNLCFSAESQKLKKALDQVLFAVSQNETQPEISGILLSHQGNHIKLVATDRYRLAEKKLSQDNISAFKDCIVPHKTCSEISRIIGSLSEISEIVINENQFMLKLGETRIISRLIDGEYPDYKHILPEEFSTVILTNRQELQSAFKTSGIFSSGNNSVKMSYFENSDYFEVSSGAGEYGESVTKINCARVNTSGSILFNFRYVQEVLSALEGQSVQININSDSSPVVFTNPEDKEYLYLVMPIKI